MSILITGVEMPTKDFVLSVDIFPDGTVSDRWTCRIKGAQAVPIPPHGRLIEVEHLKETLDYYIREAGWGDEINKALRWVKDEFIESEPVIVPAERSEE